MSAFDEIQDFFNFSKPHRTIVLDGQQTNGVLEVEEDFAKDITDNCHRVSSVEPLGVDYAEPYRQREAELAKTAELQRASDTASSRMDGMEDFTSIGQASNLFELEEDTLNHVYQDYTTRKRNTTAFPIDSMKEAILNNILSYQAVIVTGPTGCGKTTQVPQWILDNCYERRVHCNVIVTQPRRIAAISIATRVAQERGWELGKTVGYQVGLDAKTSENTRLQYVTTGVLLQKLVGSQSMTQYTHIILDEVHERGQDMDFLMILVRRLAATNSKNVKVILMSATIELEKFIYYFSLTDNLPAMKINPKQQHYEVNEFYLDNLSRIGVIPELKRDEPGIAPGTYMLALNLLKAFDKIDRGENDIGDPNEADEIPSVLVFLPGINEIEDMYKLLNDQSNKNPDGFNWKPIALHSSVTSAEQAQVFIKAPPKYRKIILSTNIAESSITVPDIKYVVDFCLARVLVTDRSTGFSSLQLEWAAKTSTVQRAGRAGRVRDGRVYRLVTKSFYDNLEEEPTPEMLRCPLERLILLSKMLNMGSPKSILALAMDPPDLTNITNTILTLKEVGGLLSTHLGVYNTEDGDLTYLGRLMSMLPLDVHVSKLIILGHIFGCIEECIIMGATMSVRNIFSTPFQERLNSYNTKLAWADRSASDCVAYLHVYQIWEHLMRSKNISDTKRWAKQSFVSDRALREARILVDEVRRRLQREGLVPNVGRSIWNAHERALILKIVLAGAFYPHIFILPGVRTGGEGEASGPWRDLCGRDARNTVYLTGWDLKQPQQLYVGEIKKLFKPCLQDTNDVTVTFDTNNSKVFVTFPREGAAPSNQNDNNRRNPSISGLIVLPVYKAIKMRQLRIPLQLRVMPHMKAKQFAIEAGIPVESKSVFDDEYYQSQKSSSDIIQPAKLPDVDDSYIDLKISYMIDCGHFYAQYADQVSMDMLIMIDMILNQKKLEPIKKQLYVGMACAAPWAEGQEKTRLYRAKIEGFLLHNMIKVQFVDYGNYASVKRSELRSLIPKEPEEASENEYGERCIKIWEIPAMTISCTLAEIGPSVTKDFSLNWSQEANLEFHKITTGRVIMGQVYSVAHGVVALVITVNNFDVNEHLVMKHLAQRAEETYASKLNHNLRESARNMQPKEKLALNKEQERTNLRMIRTPRSPNINGQDLTDSMFLKGPFSPLECSVRGLLRNVRDCSISIEWNSVNSVILNNNPPDIYDRFIVASCVNQNNSGSLTLRNTTLLPALGGLGAIIGLIFSPNARLRRAHGKFQYAGALFGLGADGLGIAYNPEHDMYLEFDVEVNNEDLQNVNHLRYLMNLMLMTGEGQDEPSIEDNTKNDLLKEIKKIFLMLITRPRAPFNPPYVKNTWRWSRKALPRISRSLAGGDETDDSDPEDIHDPPNFEMDERAVYPLHSGLKLLQKQEQFTHDMSLENRKLHGFANSLGHNTRAASNTMSCSFCGGMPMTRPAMKLHLQSIYHKEVESRLPILPDE